MKTCTKCNTNKPDNQFFRDAQKSTGLSPTCKPCKDKINTAWAKKNKPKVMVVKNRWLEKNRDARQIISLRSHLKRKYGMTLEEYADLVKSQNGLCAICKQPETVWGRLVVDHCHTTGRVRNLLCGACNSIIGLAKESVSSLESCKKYLDDIHACTLAAKNIIVKMK